MEITLIIFQLAVLIFSVIVHEVSHGAIAYYLGDDTAYRMGRLTLNPLKHIDPFGSIILPALLSIPLLFGARPIIVGWAKPVPYDPRCLKNPTRGAALIAFAGPASNIIVAVVFILAFKVIAGGAALAMAFQFIILINLMLALFNLVPIPPLDGSKILAVVLPAHSAVLAFLERNSLILLLFFIVFGLPFVQALVEGLYRVLMMVAGVH